MSGTGYLPEMLWQEAERDRMFGKVCEDMNPGMRTDVEKLVYYQSEETVEQVKKLWALIFA